YEPRFLHMFQDLAAKAAGGQLVGARFGHVLSPGAAPPALMAGSVGGVPRVGVLAGITGATAHADGTLLLEYQGLRRIQLLSIWQSQPYLVGAASYMADEAEPSDAGALDVLEWELHGLLQELGRLTRQLSGPGGAPAGLPESIARYAPQLPPRSPQPRTIAQYLTDAGHPAGNAISTWQRHGSLYGAVNRGKDAVQDPYAVLSEQLGGDTRAELFSFAAACLLELGPAEQLALLTSRDRAARLRWVAAAVGPFLEEQRARASVERVLGGLQDGGGEGLAA
ncbi:hypothetical protein TSOC_005692, partial [Tetrabaena socialis]